ncbi:MAG: ADP-ribosylglycohydrolase family protein [Actinomycetota bacterium]
MQDHQSVNVPERIAGAILGLACGDALGAPAEFRSQAEVRDLWGHLTEMVGGGPWAPGEWTDDTGMALCMAEGLLTQPADPVAEVGARFLQWRETAKDVGSTIAAALSGFQGDWAEAGRSTPQARQGQAAGNGSLMRTLPVALAYPQRERLLKQSARLSAMTHWDPQAEVCCAVYGLWISELLRGKSLAAAWREALRLGRRAAAHGLRALDTPGPEPLPEGFWERLERVETLEYGQLQPTGYAGYVVDCLEAAVWCCLHADSLEAALVRAVNLAAEADTIAAVAGGAAGAAWGAAALPERWLAVLHERERLERVAGELTELRRHHEAYGTPGLPPFACYSVLEQVYAGRNPLTARDARQLQGLGITHVLDLREEWERSSGRFGTEALRELERLGVQRRHLPIVDATAAAGAALDAAWSFLEEVLAAPEARVYVHCRAGQGRTGMVLLAYFARSRRLPGREALDALRSRCQHLSPLQHQFAAVEAWLAQRAG